LRSFRYFYSPITKDHADLERFAPHVTQAAIVDRHRVDLDPYFILGYFDKEVQNDTKVPATLPRF
jgi:hypothetical protein